MGNNDILIYVVVAVPLVAICAAVYYITVFRPFADAKRYIMEEIHRAHNEKEYRHWKRQLKKLYLAQIPFVGDMISGKMK